MATNNNGQPGEGVVKDMRYYQNDEGVAEIRNQIKVVFDKTPGSNAAPHSDPIGFSTVMGDDKQEWWRVMIDQAHWTKALTFAKDKKSEPGLFYDADKSPGFQKAMLQAYHDFLVTNVMLAYPQQLDWTVYESLWTAATKDVETTERGQKFEPNNGEVYFGCTRSLSPEVFAEMIDKLPLVLNKKDPSPTDAPLKCYAYHLTHVPIYLFPQAKGTDLHNGVNKVFELFVKEMGVARTRLDQLVAIARTIRNLHIMHAFTDGCGRTNVYLLLPAMLLRFGFGLPLGGANMGSVAAEAQFFMFNGGYSVHEIAEYLWAYQDFGRMALKDGKPTVVQPFRPNLAV
jgi:hypothetical protein